MWSKDEKTLESARVIALTLCMLGGLASSSYAQTCTPTSRTKVLPPTNEPPITFNIHDGWGRVGSQVTNLRVVLVEQMYEDCKISTSYVLDYRQSNPTSQKGSAWAALSFINKSGVEIKRDAITVPIHRHFCGPYQAPHYREFHYEKKLPDNLFDSTETLRVRNNKISGRIGQC
jgi:hypothetical protein